MPQYSYRKLTPEEKRFLRQNQIQREGEVNPKPLDTQLFDRIRGYLTRRNSNPEDFTLEQFKERFGPNPKCYLTGLPIDYANPDTFHLDHFIPVSRGGRSTLENLRLCCPAANRIKKGKMPRELIDFCRTIVAYYDAQQGRESLDTSK